jgi:CO/xanthine dehydrogenase Mo-binding subunit
VRIDTTAARRAPGVLAVITGADLPNELFGRRMRDMPVLARDKVRYVGERVAAVAAETEEAADAALALIEVDYEELPAVFDSLEAMKPGAPLVHPKVDVYQGHRQPVAETPNTYATQVGQAGDLEAGFKAADRIFEHVFHTQSHHQGYIEPHAAFCHIAEDGRVHGWLSCKQPFAVRNQLAQLAQIERDQVVMHVTHLGGDFGGKGSAMELPIAYFLAKATGRPVKLMMTYTEELTSANPRNPGVITLRTGVKNDGTITAHHARTIWNSGAYQAFLPQGLVGGGMGAAGLYRMSNVLVENIGVYTNEPPRGHVRAPGAPQVCFALESHVDMVARGLGMDPLAFRLKNSIGAGDKSPLGEPMRDCLMRETLQAGADAAGWTAPKPRKSWGRGISMYDRHVGSGEADVSLRVTWEGDAVVTTSVPDTGTGSHTIMQQIVAETLKIPLNQVSIRTGVTTDDTGIDAGAGGSRVTYVHGSAAQRAAQAAIEKLKQGAAAMISVPADQLTYTADRFTAPNGRWVTWTDAVHGAWNQGPVEVHEHFEGGSTAGVACIAVQVAEVEVDEDTGEVKVLRIVSANDVGTVINPIYHQGQIEGGVMQGVGFALTEELKLEGGHITTTHLGEYKLPAIKDIPELVTVLVQQTPIGPAPFNSKAIGEMGNVPTAAAIANAVEDAVGVRITDLPITAEKVYRALKAKGR